jgi:4-hydroxy-4-methyl-2-oxoglutarate aldolase
VNLQNPPDAIRELTRLYQGERGEDGRPRVSDDLVERMKLVTTEEAWGTLRRNGFESQFEGGWFQTHPSNVLVGRAVTARFVPSRPDLQELVEEQGKADSRTGGQNSWVIDTLQPNDVMVVEMFGKINEGTFVGDNLGTSVRTRTRAGAVLDCGIRDFQGISKLSDVAFFCRGLHPSAIKNCTLVGINYPIQIGAATVLPGDVVLGTPTGVTFVPPHLAEAVVQRSEDVRVRDEFGHQMLREGRYTPGEIDRVWTPEIEGHFQEWLKAR